MSNSSLKFKEHGIKNFVNATKEKAKLFLETIKNCYRTTRRLLDKLSVVVKDLASAIAHHINMSNFKYRIVFETLELERAEIAMHDLEEAENSLFTSSSLLNSSVMEGMDKRELIHAFETADTEVKHKFRFDKHKHPFIQLGNALR